MPRLIKAGRIVEDDWQQLDPDAATAGMQQILGLDQWLQLEDKTGRAVLLEPGQAPAPLFDYLGQIPLVAIDFPVFMDGRGFSYGRELRERGFAGELRACGHFIRDQMTYLARCGFDAFQMADESRLEDALAGLADFSEHYQAAIDQPLPLFRRRG
ncbi:MAG: DUF934 domain-containing protein [Gammaproteobacteria bacterium]|jgi:uncharacterized protein (DUF934 family)|nr:DUF934 domain-containing protein [Gammaproteobacteria bacterium]MDH5172817.1 DUF934 domain-containing protein [Gammaproteobacteria bacterium]